MTYNEFSIMVNKYIEDENLTLEEFSEEIGISKLCLLKVIASDYNIPIHKLNKVAAFFKMQLKIQIKE